MIISDAITSVYRVIAVWIPVTVEPTSLATVAIDTFMTELSRVIRNCPAANVISTMPAAPALSLPVLLMAPSLRSVRSGVGVARPRPSVDQEPVDRTVYVAALR